MAETCVTKGIESAPTPNNQVRSENQKQNNSFAGIDPLELAYLFIFESVQIGRDTAQTQAKNLENNAVLQNKLIGEAAQMNFKTLRHSQLFTPKGSVQKLAQSVLKNLEFANQEISAIRSVLEDQLNVVRQNAQLAETNVNSTMDESQQSVQQGGSLMQMLTNLTGQISRI